MLTDDQIIDEACARLNIPPELTERQAEILGPKLCQEIERLNPPRGLNRDQVHQIELDALEKIRRRVGPERMAALRQAALEANAVDPEPVLRAPSNTRREAFFFQLLDAF